MVEAAQRALLQLLCESGFASPAGKPFAALSCATRSSSEPRGYAVSWQSETSRAASFASSAVNKLGQYYAWNRTYDINTGRWTTPDPVESPSWNLFDYVGNNSLQRTDASGLDIWLEEEGWFGWHWKICVDVCKDGKKTGKRHCITFGQIIFFLPWKLGDKEKDAAEKAADEGKGATKGPEILSDPKLNRVRLNDGVSCDGCWRIGENYHDLIGERGVVYEDNDGGSEIDGTRLELSCEESNAIFAYMAFLDGATGEYAVIGRNCRTFAEEMYRIFGEFARARRESKAPKGWQPTPGGLVDDVLKGKAGNPKPSVPNIPAPQPAGPSDGPPTSTKLPTPPPDILKSK